MANRESEHIGQNQIEASDSSHESSRRPNDQRNRKQYVCTYENCNKSFTRSDHLTRHSLNHGPGKSTCPRCSAHFNRPDLLDRHLARHRQRDEEAGGYGLGVVETRKRMWRDADGNIVNKRPKPSNDGPAIPHLGDGSISGNSQHANCNNDINLGLRDEILPTPRSMGSDSTNSNQHQTPTRNFMSEGLWEYDTAQNYTNDSPEMCEFLTNSSWGSQQQPHSLMTSNPFDDMFSPDTASSFNMPFTTMNNYNWLFDGNEVGGDIRKSVAVDPTQNQTYPPTSNASFNASNTSLYFDDTSPNIPHMQDMSSSRGPWFAHAMHQTTSNGLRQKSNSSVMGTITTASTYERSIADEFSSENFPVHHSPESNSQTTMSDHESLSQQQSAPHTAALTSPEEYSQTSRPTSRKGLPVIDKVTRQKILDVIVQANPKTPEGTPITRNHSLLSPSALQNYSDLFFRRFNKTYPLLHQPTFEPAQVEPLLTVSVLLLGATYGDKAGHRLAVCIHDVLRAQIFSNAAFQAQPELWVLQTILLVECFGKSRAGQTQHDMAHLFHGLLINLIRRSDCQTVCHPKYQNQPRDLESKWRVFVDVEQRKRLAFLCFLWDTQHAVLFSQSLCMSAFELRSSLPCNPASWEAESAEDWYKNYSRETETWFLTVLKLYVKPGSDRLPLHLNDLSRLLILHGLMSISWDMKRREQTSLGFVGPTAQEKQTRLADSYDAWKADFDTHCMSMALSLKDNPSLKKDFTRFSTASIAIYHAAHIILNVEIIDLQIYAGASHIIGRPVTRGDFERSRRIVKKWATPGGSSAEVKAAWHAAHLLREGIMDLDNWDVNDVFHYPWCLYLATLTCWAFHFAGSGKNDRTFDDRCLRSTEQVGDASNAQAEMSSLVSGMTSVALDGLWKSVGKYNTSGLTAMIAKHLSTVRWAVVHEGMKILKGLATERREQTGESVSS
ncbi:Zinc finger protein [Lachnellula suecica]|uniref:Zinc finger protein n=1 Tax=Lachnellula suecica TaxID=602035 RepID=A0A8T9C7F3_9HELO|nr:Zinc finger protein [Lachnellula suecica]